MDLQIVLMHVQRPPHLAASTYVERHWSHSSSAHRSIQQASTRYVPLVIEKGDGRCKAWIHRTFGMLHVAAERLRLFLREYKGGNFDVTC